MHIRLAFTILDMRHKIKLKITIRISNSSPTMARIAQIACINVILKSQDQISNNSQWITMDKAGDESGETRKKASSKWWHNGNGCNCNCPHNQPLSRLAKEIRAHPSITCKLNLTKTL